METNIIYKYRAPDALPGDETTITARALDLDLNEVLTGVHLPGETITLEAYDTKQYGEASREYVVLDRHPLITQWGSSGAGSSIGASILLVVVTDAD